MFLLLKDDMVNSVWFTCVYISIYSTYMHILSPHSLCIFLVYVTFSIHIIQRVCLHLKEMSVPHFSCLSLSQLY